MTENERRAKIDRIGARLGVDVEALRRLDEARRAVRRPIEGRVRELIRDLAGTLAHAHTLNGVDCIPTCVLDIVGQLERELSSLKREIEPLGSDAVVRIAPIKIGRISVSLMGGDIHAGDGFTWDIFDPCAGRPLDLMHATLDSCEALTTPELVQRFVAIRKL